MVRTPSLWHVIFVVCLQEILFVGKGFINNNYQIKVFYFLLKDNEKSKINDLDYCVYLFV